ncbi:MAG TPA: FKBP-type peptidyl-prolyl cis-trans isomerase [Candidatus Acidoferrum sp.]|nr:FKBP-type peptidyl-prolyl cis-trans isomerase [Candidatus Acidoferrum sp.]
MRKPTIAVLFLAIALLAGNALAQQTQAPASGTQQAPAAKPQAPSAATTAPKTAAKSSTAAAPALTTDRAKESYALGMNIGKGLKAQSVDVDTTILLRGLKDTLSGNKLLLTDEQAVAALSQLQSETRKKQDEVRKELGDKNLKEGTAFLAANKTKVGVVTLASGLQYKILKAGTGPKPTAADTVVCQYRGTLVDGTEFDSSAKHGGPATFPVGRIIKGWTEALQLMPVGSKWQLVIPPDLAYGTNGAGSMIGPNATLIFEVELLSIKQPNEPPPAPAPAPAPAPNK